MIIFNTIKAAKHYVKWCNKTKDYDTGGYDYQSRLTYIDGEYVKVNLAGDGCGCGCDMYRYSSSTIIGRIKAYDEQAIRDNKLKNILP